jgi:hypothetical protein
MTLRLRRSMTRCADDEVRPRSSAKRVIEPRQRQGHSVIKPRQRQSHFVIGS